MRGMLTKLKKVKFVLIATFFSFYFYGAHGEQLDDKSKIIKKVDVAVYGATPSGILAAMAVKREGKSVIIIEPSKWVGGILGSGIKPLQDMAHFPPIGGTTRNLMLTLGVNSDAEKSELENALAEFSDHTRTDRGDIFQNFYKIIGAMSPKKIRNDFVNILNEYDIDVIYSHRLNYVKKERQRIKSGIFDFAPFDEVGLPPEASKVPEHLEVEAAMFIDASYEGELMARSGVSFRVGRESTSDYNEELAGVRPFGNITPISPFIVPDDPNSGLLPLVENDDGKPIGASDQYVQAYNYRFYVTTDSKRKAVIEPPEDYRAMDYELVGRYVDYLKQASKSQSELFENLRSIFPGWLNAGEYNYQRASLITIAPLGISHLYADGDYATKARVWKAHQDYLRGLHHFLSTDKRVPEKFRKETANLGLAKDYFPDTHGWPNQLYLRESRRMIGRYILTAHDVYNRTQVADPIGLAQYGIDTYPARRIWFKRDGAIFVAIEGNMFIGGDRGPTNVPYAIPYRAITPKRNEATNLLVSVTFSASHLGYASARMEPTFMIVGESAGVAAAQALDENVPVQDINMARYLKKLNALGQRLDWAKVK